MKAKSAKLVPRHFHFWKLHLFAHLVGSRLRFGNLYWNHYRFLYWGLQADGRWHCVIVGRSWFLEFEKLHVPKKKES